ncbi:MAG: hypothetical protein JNM63_14235, partial [Spirochaetia bacterium]|nr:hypothetical protein [Spirochaetia bacterium]
EVLTGTNEYIYYLTYNVTILAAVGSNIGFTITNGSFGFSDPIADSFSQSSFASGSTSGPALQSNATIVSFNYTPWDFNVIANANVAPPSIGVSNLYLMSYFDLRADEESPANEILTNVGVRLFGISPNLAGEIRLYRDTNDMTAFLPTVDRLVTNAWFTNNQTSVNLNFTGENNLNTLSSTPDQHNRFYLALRLTNAQAAVYTNTIGLYATNLAGTYGASAAVFTNLYILTNIAAQTSRVDSHQLSVYIQSNNGQDVKQGSFNNLVFKMVFTNFDVDASNYFSGLVVSNAGNSSNADLGFFRLYRDTGNGTFESTNDTLVMLGSMNANRQFNLSANPAVAMGTGETIFWGSIDVDLAAVTNRRISLLVPQISNNVTFSDVITESSFASYDQRPTLATTGPYPAVLNSNNILNFNSQPFDFYVQAVSYSAKPVSFTTNQKAPLGHFDLYRDVDVNPVVLTDVDVAVLTSGAKNAVSGFAY